MLIKDTSMPTQIGASISQGSGQFDRIGVSAVDGDASAIQTFPCSGTSVATIAVVCDTALATITLRMIYFNGSYLPCGTSMPITFTAGKAADFGQLFMGVPDSDMWRPVSGANSVGIKVDNVSAGRWSIHGSVG
jgi:uncharacterized protein (UPF0212 family)